jgi:hypothetical protein
MMGARMWWLAGAAIVLVIAAAAATPEGFGGFLQTGGPDRVVLPEGLRIHQYLFAALVVLLGTVYVAARIVGRREGIALPPRRSPWRLVAGFLLLVMIVNFVPIVRERLDAWFAGGDATEQPRGELPSSGERPTPERSRLLGYLLAAFMAMAVLGFVGILWLLLGREPGRRAPPGREEIQAAIDAGLVDLRTIADPRAAVLACYARLQVAADEAGVGRRPSDTPLELLQRLLEDGRAEPEAARRLTELFEIARFSPHTIDDAMRGEAISALEAAGARLVVPS